jgi:hypothetical protein
MGAFKAVHESRVEERCCAWVEGERLCMGTVDCAVSAWK